MTLDSHNSAYRHGLGKVKAWEGGGGHSKGICQEPGIESKCERHKTQRRGGHEKRQLTKCQETKKKNKKDPLLVFTFFLQNKFAL